VAPHSRAGLERHEAVWLGGGRIHHLPDVDAHPVAQDRQLVHEGDVHRAEHVLEQLGELRLLGAGDRDHLVADELVQLDRAVQALLGQRAHDLGRVAERVVGAARVDALRREGKVEVAAGRQPRLLEERREALARGARVGGGLEHHELPLLQHARQGVAGVDQRLEVWLAVAGQRGRHGHHDGVHLGQVGVAGGRVEALADPGEHVVGDVLDVRATGAQRLDDAPVDVHAHHVLARLGEGDGQRQPDISEADYPDPHSRAV
jgi:hypothetical protein